MTERKEIEFLANDIMKQLQKLEATFWDVFVYPGNYDDYYLDQNGQPQFDYEKEDKKTWLYHGTKTLYYRICLFLELKKVPFYLKMFKDKFEPLIDNPKKLLKSRGPLYQDDEPSMVVHDEFREFLNSFQEFKSDFFNKLEVNKLKQVLENTNSILNRTNVEVTNETSIYKPVKWMVEIVYPSARNLNKARFVKKFGTYQPDILIPEISSAVEYKFIRKGVGIEKYLDQIKTDADNYEGDLEYKFFYAVVYFEDKSEINPASFQQAIYEKKFPDNWILIAL